LGQVKEQKKQTLEGCLWDELFGPAPLKSEFVQGWVKATSLLPPKDDKFTGDGMQTSDNKALTHPKVKEEVGWYGKEGTGDSLFGIFLILPIPL